MVKRVLVSVILIAVFCCVLVACSTEEADLDGKVKVTFELEGATYKNSDRPVSIYLDLDDSSSVLITDIFDTKEGYALEKNGYEVTGWYRTKNQDGTYSDQWNFSTDTIDKDGVTLYADWQPQIKYSYAIYYKTASSETMIGTPYYVKQGAKFNDTLKHASKKGPKNHTFLKFVKEDGTDWDTSFTHPGGDTDLEIKVYAEYIEGDWALVSSLSELKKSKTNNIYLMEDIDFEGGEFNFGNYTKHFNGNGHTLKNFSVSYDPSRAGLVEDKEDNSKKSLYISLFGNMSGATVENLVVENMTISVNTTYKGTYKIYVAPISTYMTESTVRNVTVKDFELITVKTPWDANATDKEEYYIVSTDTLYGEKDTASVVENSTVTNKTV